MLHEKGEIGKKKDTKQKVYTGGTTVKEEGRNRRIEKWRAPNKCSTIVSFWQRRPNIACLGKFVMG